MAEDVRDEIAVRLRQIVGQRLQGTAASKMGVSRSRLQQMLAGDIPRAWLYLRALREDGYDINELLTGE